MIDPRTGQPMPMTPQGGGPQGAPPQAAPPPGAGAPGRPQPQQVPPQVAQHIDPNNAIQMLLMQRVDKLTPQQGQALQAGISPAAAQVLKLIIPEIGFLIDMIHSGGLPAGGGAPPPQGAPQGAPQPPLPAPGGPPGPPQPRPPGAGLSRF